MFLFYAPHCWDCYASLNPAFDKPYRRTIIYKMFVCDIIQKLKKTRSSFFRLVTAIVQYF